MELIQQLVSGLGINENQAEGGAGLLFQLAKNQLGQGDFAQVASAVPGIEGLMQAAPGLGGESSGGGGGLVGKVMSMFGGNKGGAMGNLAGLAGLVGGFSQLGLDAGMVSKFVPIVTSFVQEQGGEQVASLLQGVLK